MSLLERMTSKAVSMRRTTLGLGRRPFRSLNFTGVSRRETVHRNITRIVCKRKGAPRRVFQVTRTVGRGKRGTILVAEVGGRSTVCIKRHLRLRCSRIDQVKFVNRIPVGSKSKGVIITANKADSVPITRRTTEATRALKGRIIHLCSMNITKMRHLLKRLSRLVKTHIVVTMTKVRKTLTDIVKKLISYPIVTIPADIKCKTSFNNMSTLLSVLGSYTDKIDIMGVSGKFNTKFLTDQVGRVREEAGR